MTISHSIRSFLLLCAVLAMAACSARQQPLAQLEPDVLYTRGMEAFEAGRHGRAVEFLEAFVREHVGDERVPQARYTLGEAYLARREHITAAAEFQRLVAEFPNHPLMLDARLMVCEAYAQVAPEPPLDQEYTASALQHCQVVAQNFPGTPQAETAAQRVVELRHRIARKDYQNGMFYFRRRAYDAAVIYFRQVVENFPDTTVAPTALLRMVESFEHMGYEEDAAETRERLLREYPDSPEAAELAAAAS